MLKANQLKQYERENKMARYKMIAVNEAVYNKISTLQEELNADSIVTYSRGNVIQLALEALEKGEQKNENRNN